VDLNIETDFILWIQSWNIVVRKDLHSVAYRGLVMPGATAWWYAPLPNSNIEQWRMVVVTGYTMFVTSQCDIIFPFANQCFGYVC